MVHKHETELHIIRINQESGLPEVVWKESGEIVFAGLLAGRSFARVVEDVELIEAITDQILANMGEWL